MTKRTLTRRFLAETGMTVAQWRTRARLLVALEWELAVAINLLALTAEEGIRVCGDTARMNRQARARQASS